MNRGFTSFYRIRFFFQDIFFGAGFGALWSGLLGLLIYRFISPSILITHMSPWLGGVVGFVFGSIASFKFSRTVGYTQEREQARIEYGHAIWYMNRVISTCMGAFAGYCFNLKYSGIIFGGVVGYLIISKIGDCFSFVYLIIGGKILDVLSNVHSLLKGSTFDSTLAVINIVVDIPFKIVETICIKGKLISKEKLTGISVAGEHYENGIKCDDKNNTDEAIREYEKAVEINPGFPEAYLNLGHDYGLLGNTEKEIVAYKKAIELKADYVKALHSLAMTYVEVGREDEAARCLGALKKLRPADYRDNIDEMILSIRKQWCGGRLFRALGRENTENTARTISVPQLARSYEVPERTLNPYTPAGQAKALPKLKGRSLFIDFDKDIDGPQTATRLVREALGRLGVVWVKTIDQAEAIVWIQGGSSPMRFAFVIADQRGGQVCCCGMRAKGTHHDYHDQCGRVL